MMTDPIYISESGMISGLEPVDIIPSETEAPIEYTAPVIAQELTAKIDEEGAPNFDNVAISGTFRTNDIRADASIAFITVRRNVTEDNVHLSHYYNGYGIAIRPLTASGIADGQLNVFVVDNSLARRDVVLEDVLHTGWGDYAYLAATSASILPSLPDDEHTYNFNLLFLDNGGLEFYIWESGSPMPVTPTITYGAHTLISDGKHWGIGVSNTGGYQWIWESINLSNLDEARAVLYCSLYAANMPETFSAVCHGWGERINDPTGANYGIKMYVRKNTDPTTWDAVSASHNYGPDSIEQCLLQLDDLNHPDHVDSEGFCHLMIIAEDASEYDSGIDSQLVIDDVYLESYSTDSVHVGGCGDVYVQDSGGPQETYFDIWNNQAQEWILATNQRIVSALNLPILWPYAVEVLDPSGEPTGVFLTPLTDWTFNVNNADLRFSTREDNYLLFSVTGINVRVYHHYIPSVGLAQAECEDRDRENTVYDLLLKYKEPHELFIEADITGSSDPATIRTLIAQWINGTKIEEITTIDIEIKMQEDELMSNASVTSLMQRIHGFDGTVTEETEDTLTLEDSTIEQFIIVADADHIILNVV